MRVAIGDAEARELGFGETLDLFDRSFSAPWAWTVLESHGPPASGYAETSVVAVETAVFSIDHLVPELEGCADRLSVELDISLSTDDGAISIAGKIHAYAEKNLENAVFGRLDLATASGSLRVSPPEWPQPTVGYLVVLLKFWPDTVRGAAYVELIQAGDDPNDDINGSHQPLDARFPIDSCEFWARPLVADEPSAVLLGKSFVELQSELASRLEAQQLGTWNDGSQTPVTAELGEPSWICDGERGYVDYEIPLEVSTGDGRVHIEGQAQGFASVDSAGTLDHASFGIFNGDGIPSTSFAATSGISGVDLTGLSAARLHTSIQLLDPTNLHGELVIVGIDSEGVITGVIEQLTWQLE